MKKYIVLGYDSEFEHGDIVTKQYDADIYKNKHGIYQELKSHQVSDILGKYQVIGGNDYHDIPIGSNVFKIGYVQTMPHIGEYINNCGLIQAILDEDVVEISDKNKSQIEIIKIKLDEIVDLINEL